MGPNRSTAVMQRRRCGRAGLDYFPTPPFATRALCEFLAAQGEALAEQTAWEPACGELHMVRPLREVFAQVRASDVQRYGDDEGAHDVLDFPLLGGAEPPVDWVITNPPFRLAEAFIATGLQVARRGVAMLVRSAFLEGGERYRLLFAPNPPTWVLQFVERVVMLDGRLVRRGAVDPFGATEGATASSATAYCWLVWRHECGGGGTRLHWIEPAFRRLERPGDYPAYPVAQSAPGALFGAGA